jgi:imidazolonepropionase-like amidohydrolase
MRSLAALSILIAIAAPVVAATPPAPVAFVDVTVVPMDRDVELPHQTVVVGDGRIRAIGPVAAVEVPNGAMRIDGRGRWLMPGLTDAHVHLESPEELRLYLASGVTSVFNLHGSPAHLEWRRQVEEGALAGAAVITTGPIIARRTSREDAIREVDAQAAAGYAAVKIYNQVGRDEYDVLAAEAKARGLLVVGHVPREPGFDAAVRAGQSIVHAEELIYTALNPTGDESAAPPIDRTRIPGTVQAIARAGIFVTPTLSMYRDILRQAGDLPAYLHRPEAVWLAPWVRARLEPGVNRYDGRFSTEEQRRMADGFAIQRELVRALHDAGVPLLAGTDSTQVGPVAGFSLHEELAELVASGLSPFEALRTATVNARRHLGAERVGGVVQGGARADLILLADDPRRDIGNVRRIDGVMAKGRWYDREQLAAQRESLPRDYARAVDDLVRQLDSDPIAFDRELRQSDPFGVRFAAVMVESARRDGSVELRRRLRRLRREVPQSTALSEEALNALGYALFFDGECDAAIEAFEENVAAFPLSTNARDSLAEARARSGQLALAVEGYWLALALDPDYANADAARRFLKENDAH